MKTCYITKWALTQGILEADGGHWNAEYGRWAFRKMTHGYWSYSSLDCHDNRADAVKRVKQMASAKIARLKKEIERLENMVAQ